jgi:hypothetical protein
MTMMMIMWYVNVEWRIFVRYERQGSQCVVVPCGPDVFRHARHFVVAQRGARAVSSLPDGKSKISVVVRKRPLNAKERKGGETDIVRVNADSIVVHEPKYVWVSPNHVLSRMRIRCLIVWLR